MRSFSLRVRFFIPLFALLTGCSTVPQLEEATGTTQSDVLMNKVVTRVRCEVADAFDDLIDTPRYRWLADWTAKVDLTLQANNAGGIAPGVTYTHFYKNAFNYGAGSTSLTSNSISAVNQFFTFGAGANLGEQAVRAEVISFTLSLKELKRWRSRVAKYEQEHPEERVCIGADGGGLTGNLGLQEWIASALAPVGPDVFALHAGYHPSPVSTVKPSSAPGPGKAGAPFAGGGKMTYAEAIDRLKAASAAARAAADASAAAAKRIAAYPAQINRAVYASWPVLESDIKRQINSNVASLKVYAAEAASGAAIAKQRTDEVQKEYEVVLYATPKPDQVPEQQVVPTEDKKNEAVAQQQYVNDLETEANKILAGLKRIDPPLDSLLHSVSFVLTYGASATPNWTLLQWKGPSPSGASTFAAAGQRTHVLNIALGPNAGEQNRLIQNQTVASH
ncbi:MULTISPECIES: hypothetical protein [unclassified Bradyrhizobium]|uniref:hypothetical protein n=2 Tax=Bradyrhizobium TaxID=374 RepID=UPI002916E8AE|nr:MULTISPECIES: hypothetical protein [unclassified Bradyrhizobium]